MSSVKSNYSLLSPSPLSKTTSAAPGPIAFHSGLAPEVTAADSDFFFCRHLSPDQNLEFCVVHAFRTMFTFFQWVRERIDCRAAIGIMKFIVKVSACGGPRPDFLFWS